MTQQMVGVRTFSPTPPVRIEHPQIDWRAFAQRYKRYANVAPLFALLLVIFGAVIFAGALTANDPMSMDLSKTLLPPVWMDGGSLAHPLGTDNLGRDIFSRTLHGGQISLKVAFIAGTVSTVLGMVLGVVGGYVGGMVDRTLLYISDLWISFPFLVLALAIISAVGGSVPVLIILLSAAGWVHAARITRATTLKLKEADYVQASLAIGARPLHILWKHIVPGIINPNIVMWTFSIGTMIVIEGSLSFIGMGVSTGTPSWGTMLSDGRHYLRDAWWMSIFPGMALMTTILAVNYLGDALQDLNNH
jgi:peptide/nickel transport system permease protein